MCGISVLVSKNNQGVSAELMKKMNDKIIHR
jgi:asparagine synthetase B (glutamine-hydrolysing)